jgi:excisionase family DNA binding protein
MTDTLSTLRAKLVDVQGVAELLDCSARHVTRLSDAGKMPQPVRLGGLVRWSAAAIDEWIAAGCPPIRHVKGGGA